MSKRGRPKGSTNAKDIVEVKPSQCKKCDSSRRTKYENTDRRDYSGAGLEYVAIIYRTCRCLDCGQARRVQEKVYAPTGITTGTPDITGEAGTKLGRLSPRTRRLDSAGETNRFD